METKNKIMPLNTALPEFYLEEVEQRLETDPLTLGGLVDLDFESANCVGNTSCACDLNNGVCTGKAGCQCNILNNSCLDKTYCPIN